MPSRYGRPLPTQIKKPPIDDVAHLSAPIAGLSLSSKLTSSDKNTAVILDNVYVQEDRVTTRVGTRKLMTHAGGQAVETIVPFHGTAGSVLAATNGKLATIPGNVDIKSGFTGNDWSWTSFSNLSQVDYTVMVNGHDGVWSWDGSTVPDTSAGPVAVTNLSSANPAVCTVASGNIGNFTDGQTVLIAGATDTGMTAANGYHVISSVGTPANTFTLTGVNTSGGVVTVTSLSNANPAVCTVAAGDIGRFTNGMTVLIAGATGTGMTAANGLHTISSVGTPTNTFTLTGVNTSSGAAPQTSGVTAAIQQTSGVTADPLTGGIRKEVVTAPSGKLYIVPDAFQIVLAHQNRLWFADAANLAVYYLPLFQKSGELKELPLNAIFKRGGSIRAMAVWTLDGGTASMNAQLVIFTSNGEAAIFAGIDPDTSGQFSLQGVYHSDAPMSKNAVANYGGELWVLISTGLVPMSTFMKAQSEQLGKYDQNIFSAFRNIAYTDRERPGWQVMLNHSSGHMICNMPARGRYKQMVRLMNMPVWSTWSDLNSRCWQWHNAVIYIGGDHGEVYEMRPGLVNDDGVPIQIDVMWAWNLYRTPAQKKFQMARVFFETDGNPQPYLQMFVDYDYSRPTSQPDISGSRPGSEWDISTWDEADWAPGPRQVTITTGIAGKGRVGAPRLRCAVLDAYLSITGIDILYEPGALI